MRVPNNLTCQVHTPDFENPTDPKPTSTWIFTWGHIFFWKSMPKRTSLPNFMLFSAMQMFASFSTIISPNYSVGNTNFLFIFILTFMYNSIFFAREQNFVQFCFVQFLSLVDAQRIESWFPFLLKRFGPWWYFLFWL